MNENVKVRCRMLVHALFLLAATGGILYFVNEILLEEHKWNQNYLLISAFLLLMIFAYCFVRRNSLFVTTSGTFLAVACFVISAMVLLLSEVYVNLPVWVIGGIIAATLLDQNLGMLYLYFFMFQAIYLQGCSLKGLILHFLIATALCILLPKMKSWLSMLYVMVFTGSLIVALSLVMNRLEFQQDMILDALPIFIIYMCCIFAAMVFRLWKKAGTRIEEETELLPPVPETSEAEASEVETLDTKASDTEADTVQKEETVVLQDVQKEEDFTAYLSEDAKLLKELREKSKSAYAHSKLIAKFAEGAAERIHANALLVRTAAMYHEVGRLREGDVSEQTLKILKEYEFPKAIMDTLVFLETEKDRIFATKEAVVLFLSDKIVTMYVYLRKSGTETPAFKIVDQTITKQILCGEWNESGLSLADCTELREYFIEQLTEQDQKRGQ